MADCTDPSQVLLLLRAIISTSSTGDGDDGDHDDDDDDDDDDAWTAWTAWRTAPSLLPILLPSTDTIATTTLLLLQE